MGLIGWLVATELSYRTLENRLSQQLQHSASMLAAGKLPITKPLLEQLANLLKAELFLFSNAKTVTNLAVEDKLAVQLTEYLRKKSLEIRNEETLIEKIKFHDASFILVYKKVTGSNPRFNGIAALAPLNDIQRDVKSAAFNLGGIVLIVLLIFAWFGHRNARKITSPISELAQMAEKIASGDREIQSQIRQENEIGGLAQALNLMTLKLKNYEQELVQKSRLEIVGELAAKVAHEVRNPLTAIKLQIQLLQEDAANEQKVSLQQVANEIRRLELIVSTTLDQTKPVELDFSLINPNEVIKEFVDLFKPQLKHRGIEIRMLLHDLPCVQLDKNRITQVITNLVINAADELKSGGVIQLGSTYLENDRSIKIIIEDSGKGILQEKRTQIFKPFSSEKSHNMGLGLSICKEIIELHAGAIDISQSQQLGGAKFVIVLPVKKQGVELNHV